MSPSDRELLETLRRQQVDLQLSLARIGDQLDALEASTKNGHALSTLDSGHLDLPPTPRDSPSVWAQTELPPVPPHDPTPPVAVPAASIGALPPIPRASLEFQFGRWLTRIGAVFGVITLVLVLSLTHTYLFAHLGRAGILGLSATFCMGVIILAERMERRDMLFFARSVLALGLAGLYVTLYGAHSFDSVRVISSPLAAGVLLLLWSIYVFFLAERKRSQSLAFFAIALAYFSTSINPVGRFSMAADLLLAGTAVVFLLRHGWAAMSYLSLLGTYFALLRRLVIDQSGQLVLDTSRALPFAPYAVYLIGAWVIFTTAVMLSVSPTFRGGKRLVFLSLNNAALAGLLTLTTYIAGYGLKAMGWTLFWVGVVYILAALSAGGRRPDASFAEVPGAYFAQGLATFTIGLVGVFNGITRGVLLALETLILGASSTFARNEVIRIAAAVTALFTTLFLVWEISANAHHPWLLGVTGAVIMITNAWWARGSSLLDRREIMPLASYYCALAIGLLAAAMASELSAGALPPALAFVAVVLTFSVYPIPLYEMPPLAQGLLLAAQALVLFPAERGEAMPRSSTAWVAFFTLVLLAWWARQRIHRYGLWIVALTFVYALALVDLSYQAVRPYADAPTWMVAASLISGAFLIFGAITRVWPLAAMGQLFLAAAVYHFFWPGGAFAPFTWSFGVAIIPIALVFFTARAAHHWLRENPEIPRPATIFFRLLAYAYKALALVMIVRMIFGLVPAHAQTGVFFALGTFLLGWNTARASSFGIRCCFVLSALGLYSLVQHLQLNPREVVTFLTGLAVFLLLCQPTLLRHGPRKLVTRAESWLLIILSAAAGWLYVNAWVATRLHFNYITMGWALYALFLFAFGLLVRERRQRWCGLIILAAAMVRVVCVDIWGFSNGYKVLTFVVLTLITLGLGFIYARFANRLKSWL